MLRTPPPSALTIAGSDSGGGAGIQADLKTFHALGVHGLSVITAVTSQNTRAVTAVHALPQAHIRSQIDAVFKDFPIRSVKTGMLGGAAVVRTVAGELARRKPPALVVDPVMIATSGARLLDAEAVAVLIARLLPLADILTPNLPEAEVLLDRPIRTAAEAERACRELRTLGPRAVLLKGGHARGRTVVDRYCDERGLIEIRHPRLAFEAHGTGCTLAAAIAAELAKGRPMRTAVRRAIAYVHRALARGYRPGGGAVLVLGH
ncbi:bifunctional hydroxymethylpyrimidine kinase/phosphomethylpyrimidine kinase [Aerosticca soli]|nr:bifunctional hydroxymethylpyrimidine kinase/phosphomethylpyrimidine kinase [Aerosticca soli]MDI3261524.1 bifunctional hydroxymethylpyrimidine kinase/phosphomethylpyrimidine kinase [Fulvimonas sp.]